MIMVKVSMDDARVYIFEDVITIIGYYYIWHALNNINAMMEVRKKQKISNNSWLTQVVKFKLLEKT